MKLKELEKILYPCAPVEINVDRKTFVSNSEKKLEEYKEYFEREIHFISTTYINHDLEYGILIKLKDKKNRKFQRKICKNCKWFRARNSGTLNTSRCDLLSRCDTTPPKIVNVIKFDTCDRFEVE